MSPMPLPAVVLFVSQVDKLCDFYRQVGQMEVVLAEAGYAILEANGFQLVIHGMKGEPAPERDAQGRVPVREDSYMKICLSVPSIAAARQLAIELGGSIKGVKSEWEARGFRTCDGHDPEGNVLQVREPA